MKRNYVMIRKNMAILSLIFLLVASVFGVASAQSPIQIGIVGDGTDLLANQLNADAYLSSKYTFTDLGDNWNYLTIKDYDAIIVNEKEGWNAALTPTETNALRQYYDSGLPLILAMDDVDEEDPSEKNDLYYIFGVTNAEDGDFNPGIVNPAHPISNGVLLQDLTDPENDHFEGNGATWIVKGDDGHYYVLAYEGVARTVIFGDRLYFSPTEPSPGRW